VQPVLNLVLYERVVLSGMRFSIVYDPLLLERISDGSVWTPLPCAPTIADSVNGIGSESHGSRCTTGVWKAIDAVTRNLFVGCLRILIGYRYGLLVCARSSNDNNCGGSDKKDFHGVGNNTEGRKRAQVKTSSYTA